MLDYYISKAIRCCGSQIKLAKKMGIKPERVSYLLNSARKISIEDAILIERATDHKITRHQLLHSLNPIIKQQLDGKAFKIRNLPISERVKQGIAYEEDLKEKKCHFNERNEAKNILLSRQNFDAKKYRTDVMVGMGKTYLQPDLALGLWEFRLQPIAMQFEKLSFREYEILNLMAKHKSYDEISDRLHISLKTIYNLKMSAFKKLSIESRDQLLEILNHTPHDKNKPEDKDENKF